MHILLCHLNPFAPCVVPVQLHTLHSISVGARSLCAQPNLSLVKHAST